MDPGIDPSDGAAPLPTGVVTFLLTDIVGSTSAWERHPDAMDLALTTHDALVLRAVTGAGGRLLKARGEGDSTFSVFARATDALDAAIAMQRSLREQTWPPPLAIWVRAALHTGEAVERDGDYFGPTVNRAARLRGLAAGGQVVASQATAELVRFELPDGIELDDLGVHVLAGSDRPEHVRAVRIAGLAEGPPSTATGGVGDESLELPRFLPQGADPLVGRDRELAALDAAWAAARRGPSRVVLLSGEAGIGKSTVAAAAARRIHDGGGLVLAGRCDEGYEVPYQPFIEALDPLVASRFGASAAALPAQLGSELARILPRAAGHLAAVAPQDADAQTARYRLFEAVAAWLGAVARTTPTMLLVEDLHWAAAPTLLLLRHVTRFPIEGLLVVATTRPTDGAPSPLADLLADLRQAEGTTDVHITGLDVDDVAELVRRAPAPITADAADIHARTGGNAFFVRELLAAGDGHDGPTASLPPRIQEVVQQRVHALSEPCRELLEAAAVLGSEITIPVLLAMGTGRRRTPTDDRLDSIDEAVAARLLEPVDVASGRFRFAHAVVRDAIEVGLGHSRRMQLHLAAAHAVATADRSPSAAVVAHHHASALPLAPEEALTACRAAAGQAMAVSAFEDAIEHDRRALEAAELAGAPTTIRIDVLLDLARAHQAAGHATEAADTARRAADLARAAGEPARLARAALCFEGEIVTGGEFWFAQLDVVEDASAMPPVDDGALHARLLAMLVHVEAAMRPGSEVEPASSQAVALAEASGDPAALAAAIQSRRHVLARPEHAEARVAISEEVVEHGAAAGDDTWTMLGRHAQLSDLLEVGDIGAFDVALGRYVFEARRLRRPHDLWRAEVMQAMRALFRGDLELGEELSRKAYEVGQRLQRPGALQAFVIQSFFVATRRGEVEPLVPFAEAWALEGTVATWRASLALAYCDVGRPDDAAALLDGLAADGFGGLAQDNLWMTTLVLAGEVAWRLGDAAAAEPLRALLAPHADRNATIGTALGLGAVGRIGGLLSATLGDLDAAVAQLDAALERNRAMGAGAWTEVTRDNLEEVLALRGAGR
jgi:class 3 adenylate cyclase